MKVYVITKGSYSDYSIYGVAVDRNMAEALQRYVSDEYEEANIEEYETDEYKPLNEGKKAYSIAINRQTGKCRYFHQKRYDIDDCDGKVYVIGYAQDAMYKIDLWATDEEHALKIARDKIAEYKYRKRVDEQ